MSRNGHTPGPWTHRLSDDEDGCAHEIMGAWQNGARRWVGGAECLEDARLIASAPVLLDVLGDALSLLDEIDNAVRAEHRKNGAPQAKSVAGIIAERARAAIADATGATP